MGKGKYKIRIPAEIRDGGYFTRRPEPQRIHSAFYERYFTIPSDLTDEEWMSIVDKIANIGGLGNLRVERIGDES